MTYSKILMTIAIASAAALPGMAQSQYPGYPQNGYGQYAPAAPQYAPEYNRQYAPGYEQRWREDDRYEQHRDLHHDYRRVERMRADIARDRARLDEDIRCGRSAAAARDARDLARDQRALDAQLRDIHRDREDLRWSYYGR